MDKFIQLPFTIPPTSRETLTRYMDGLSNIEIVAALSNELPVQGLDAEEAIVGPSSDAKNGTRESPEMAAAQVVELTQTDRTGAASKGSSSDASKRIPEAVMKFRESRDVGELIREAAGKMSGNPREIKRLANLARLYLGLRNARRRRQPSWQSPDVSQYARWITLTLRWPDMMRWLQWGADEGATSPDEPSIMLSEYRLRVLQEEAGRVKSVTEWGEALKDRLGLSCKEPTDWTRDPRIFGFFQAEALLDQHKTLRAAVASGFW